MLLIGSREYLFPAKVRRLLEVSRIPAGLRMSVVAVVLNFIQPGTRLDIDRPHDSSGSQRPHLVVVAVRVGLASIRYSPVTEGLGWAQSFHGRPTEDSQVGLVI